MPPRRPACGRLPWPAVAPLAWLVAALALANVALHAWTADGQGAPSSDGREPDRLARQVRPEAVRVLPPGEMPLAQASAAAEAADASAAADAAASGVEPQAAGCLQAGPFAAAEARTVERLLAAALGAGGWSRRPPAGAGWEVVAGPYGGDAAVERRRAELERSGVAFEPLADLPAAMPGFTLGRHGTRQAAAAALADAARRGVRDARVVAVGDVSAVLLRIDGATAAVRDRLAQVGRTVGGVPLGQRFAACTDAAPAR